MARDLAHNDENGREIGLAGLRFRIEHRATGADGGPTLHVCEANGDELLRFDCFRSSPHFHLAGRSEPIAFGPVADPVSFAIAELRSGLSGYLERAGHHQPLVCSDEELAQRLAQVEAWLRNPPARLDDLDLTLLKSRLGEKWNTYPPDILPAWVAEMDFPLAEPIRVVLERAVDRWDLGYPINPADTGLRECFSERMQRLYGWQPDPERVEILSDVVQGLYIGVQAYSEPGDGAIVQSSIYPPFFDAVRETGRRFVEHHTAAPDAGAQGYELDLDRLREASDARTRLLLFCNPHNPSGRVFRRSELEGLAELACERNWIVLTDEIHQDLLFGGCEHIPFASLGEEVAARTVTLTSATKAFNIPGLRCSVAHFGSAALHQRFNEVVPRHTRGGIGLLGLYASLAAWRHCDPWLAEVRSYLEANRDFVTQFLAREIPEIAFAPPESTYLAWLDCRALELEPGPAPFFYRHAKVALSDGRNFGKGWEGWARLNFATSRSLLSQILESLAKAVRAR
jgi:cystathionine beta-lyase